ncbi:MAG TPA: hypothetical protein VMY42_01635 [Thermoguttaceae bacterium]|nr:hypothetical protein [Thermoguttaceae bacterium]
MRRSLTALILAAGMLAGCGGEGDKTPQQSGNTPPRLKGEGYDPGPVATPIAAYFDAKRKIALFPVVQLMQMYKAEHGQHPASQEEFMKEIIGKIPNFSLDLPEGTRLVYDPEKAGQIGTCTLENLPLTVERSP